MGVVAKPAQLGHTRDSGRYHDAFAYLLYHRVLTLGEGIVEEKKRGLESKRVRLTVFHYWIARKIPFRQEVSRNSTGQTHEFIDMISNEPVLLSLSQYGVLTGCGRTLSVMSA